MNSIKHLEGFVGGVLTERRVRFMLAAGLVNELVEAKHDFQLAPVMAR